MFSGIESSPFRRLISCENKVFPKHLPLFTIYKKTCTGKSSCKTDSICESDENIFAILERKNIEKNDSPSKIKWRTVGPHKSRVDGSIERI
jgi:hypothetical protein